jgi:AcrR family transcriptional regulator
VDRRLTPRGQDRKDQLLAYGTARFAENGYHPTSVAEIVRGLGVGKGVFYWYFPSKEEFFLEILRDAQRDLRRSQRDAIAGADTPIERIERGIRDTFRWYRDHPELDTLVRFAATEERFSPSLRKGEDIAVADVARHIKDAIAEGEVPDADPVMLAHAMVGVAAQLVSRFLRADDQTAEVAADTAVSFSLHGLLGR